MAYFSIRLMALADIFGYSSICCDPYPAEIDILPVILLLEAVDKAVDIILAILA
jgi:hypothetical protein